MRNFFNKNILIILLMFNIFFVSCSVEKSDNFILPLGLSFEQSVQDVQKTLHKLKIDYNITQDQFHSFIQDIIVTDKVKYKDFEGKFKILFLNGRLYQVRFYTDRYFKLKKESKNRYILNGRIFLVKKYKNRALEYFKLNNKDILGIFFTDKDVENKVFSFY